MLNIISLQGNAKHNHSVIKLLHTHSKDVERMELSYIASGTIK